jgi:hypothetical protein
MRYFRHAARIIGGTVLAATLFVPPLSVAAQSVGVPPAPPRNAASTNPTTTTTTTTAPQFDNPNENGPAWFIAVGAIVIIVAIVIVTTNRSTRRP